MLRITALSVLILTAFTVASQSLERYKGTLRNGFTDDGEVTYSYRPDPNGREHIRHGTFRYVVRARDDQFRFNHSITGNYADNLKHGEWSYKINQRDFMLQHRGRYTTGSISVDASYNMGIPDGAWRYESSLRSRDGKKVRDKWEWERYDSVESVVVELRFTAGVITGPFYAKNGNAWEVRGSFDERGFFDGEWVWQFPDSVVTMVWDKGLEVRVTVADFFDNILHLEQHDHSVRIIREFQRLVSEGGARTADFPFTLDTVSLLRNRSYMLTELLHKTIYHPQYTLLREITGDKAVFYDQRSYRMQFTLQGMNKIEQQNRLTPAQLQSYSRIHVLVKRMETQMADVYKMRREGRVDEKGHEAIRQMETNMAIARRYMCLGETLKLYLDTDEGVRASERSCAYHVVRFTSLPEFRTREAALQHIILRITDLEKQQLALYQGLRRTPAR
jgi:hypothetical protein